MEATKHNLLTTITLRDDWMAFKQQHPHHSNGAYVMAPVHEGYTTFDRGFVMVVTIGSTWTPSYYLEAAGYWCIFPPCGLLGPNYTLALWHVFIVTTYNLQPLGLQPFNKTNYFLRSCFVYYSLHITIGLIINKLEIMIYYLKTR